MDSQQLVPIDQGGELSLSRPPATVLREAEMVAGPWAKKVESLQLYKTIGEKKHLYIEAWQMMAAMYRVTARIRETRLVQIGEVVGYEATAEAFHLPTGQIISTAEAMCLSDEERWGPRPKYEYPEGKKTQVGFSPTPLQQLRSMAQTRACSKVLANLFKWVAVQKGYQGTPAEEMTGDEPPSDHPEIKAPQKKAPAGDTISEAQGKRLYAIARQSGMDDEHYRQFLEKHDCKATADVKRADYDRIVAEVQGVGGAK